MTYLDIRAENLTLVNRQKRLGFLSRRVAQKAHAATFQHMYTATVEGSVRWADIEASVVKTFDPFTLWLFSELIMLVVKVVLNWLATRQGNVTYQEDLRLWSCEALPYC